MAHDTDTDPTNHRHDTDNGARPFPTLGGVVALFGRGRDNGDVTTSESTDKLSELTPEMRDPRFDLPRLVAGALLAAALSVGLATAFLYPSRTNTGPNVGPTAATLDDAFSTLFGAALGLLVGSGLTASFTRRGSRLATGILAGLLAYAAVLVPIVVATGPSDVSAGESFGFALVLGFPLGIGVIIGSMIGAGLGAGYWVAIGRRRPRRPTDSATRS